MMCALCKGCFPFCTASAAAGTAFRARAGPNGARRCSGAAADIAGALFGMGCYEVSMCDTIGTGTPATITAMFQVGSGVNGQCDSS